MEIDCDHYFLTSIARGIWKNNDAIAENMMLECLDAVHKEKFFARVIYKNEKIIMERMRDMAENAFLDAWEDFSNEGKAGKNKTEDRIYVGYFFRIFRNKFIKLLNDDINRIKGESGYGKLHVGEDGTPTEIEKHGLQLPRIQEVLNQMSQGCRQLLKWRFEEGFSHDTIAQNRNIKRENSIKMVARCKKTFLEMLGSRGYDLN